MSDRFMRIHGPGFQAMSERVLEVTRLTSRLNVLPFDDDAGKAALFEQILGRPLPDRVTIHPPFYTDHGLRLDLAAHVVPGAQTAIELPDVAQDRLDFLPRALGVRRASIAAEGEHQRAVGVGTGHVHRTAGDSGRAG